MNLPWRGGLLFLLFAVQDPPPARPDLVSKFATILENGPDSRRDLAGRALLTLGRPGHDAFKRILAAKPDVAMSVPALEALPPPMALVRITPFQEGAKKARDLAGSIPWPDDVDAPIRSCGTLAEPYLWEALDAGHAATATRAARLLRELYTPPGPPAGRPSPALSLELDRKRDFDVADLALTEFLKGESISWILVGPRDERITLRRRGLTLRRFLLLAAPNLAAVPEGDLLILIPPNRIASANPDAAVWAPSELAPRIETALDALARGDAAPMDGLTGVGAFHALKRAAHTARADAMRKLLEQRIYFIDGPADDGPRLDFEPGSATARETVAAFEKAAGFAIEIMDKSRLDGAPPAFRFRGVPARLAARVLAFRLNRM